MGLIKKLEQQRGFTAAESSVANYILQNQDAVVDMGIVELARNTFSSNAVIIRMCRKLELSGYKEFRIAFAADLEKSRREEVDVEVNYPFGSNESMHSIMRSVANISCEAINACYTMVSSGKIDRGARILREADRIFIYAAGDSYTMSIAFSNLLMKIGRIAIYPAQYLESAQLTNLATSRDAALIISYSGTIMTVLKREIRLLKRSGVPIVLVSSLETHPSADIVLNIPDKEQIVGKTASYYSQTATRYILNCLYGRIYSLDLQKNREFKDRADSYAYQGDGLEK